MIPRPRPCRCLLAAAALALLATVIGAAPAAAQQASYCNNRLVVDAFYNTIVSNGSRSRVDYYAQLRNTGSQAVAYNAQFTYGQGGAVIADRLQAHGQSLNGLANTRLKLASQTMANPSGAGALPSATLAPYLVITCR
ncbi:hypothetical protein [Roseomonas sp. 18066]|uniref:hypothetical protein n=1 Tax=Roseomonas sp. 18066 TaxID=2681412 RepID=UPI00135BDDFD|nr:hypothetical protein [Roseomonas sp. 18066]